MKLIKNLLILSLFLVFSSAVLCTTLEIDNNSHIPGSVIRLDVDGGQGQQIQLMLEKNIIDSSKLGCEKVYDPSEYCFVHVSFYDPSAQAQEEIGRLDILRQTGIIHLDPNYSSLNIYLQKELEAPKIYTFGVYRHLK